VAPKEKVVDGVSRLLTKTDIAVFSKHKSLDAAEQILKDAWVNMHEKIDSGAVETSVGFESWGRLATRCVLHLAKKGKLGLEKKDYTSLADIADMFHTDLAGGKQAAPSASAKADDISMPASIEDTSSPAFIACKQGFKAGNLYKSAQGKDIIRIDEFAQESVKVTVLNALLGDTKGLLGYSQLKDLREFAGKAPCTIEVPTTCWPEKNQHIMDEVKKAKAFSELYDNYCKEAYDAKKFKLIMYPNQLAVTEAFKVRELKFYPLPDSLSKISGTTSTGSIMCTLSSGDTVYISKPAMPKSSDKADWGKSMSMSYFWWVGSTDEQNDANMDYNPKTGVMTNRKALKKDDILKVYVERKADEKKRLAIKPDPGDKAEDKDQKQPGQSPQKKARK